MDDDGIAEAGRRSAARRLNRRAPLGSAYVAPAETWKAFADGWRGRYERRVESVTLEQAKQALKHLDGLDARPVDTSTRADVEISSRR